MQRRNGGSSGETMKLLQTPFITLQDVPDEISVAFPIAGCPLKCSGCSYKPFESSATVELSDELYTNLLRHNKGLATCVVFFGGEWELRRLKELVAIAKDMGYNVCLYSGVGSLEQFRKIFKDFTDELDYIKVGSYIKELGGLKSPTTNQRMYFKSTDITYKFRRM